MNKASLPSGFKIEEIDLEHQSFLQPLIKSQGVGLCEFCFSSWIIFRTTPSFRAQLITTPRGIYLQGCSRQKDIYLMPTTLEAACDQEYLTLLSPYYKFLFPISDVWLSQMALPGMSQKLLTDDSDYLFMLEKLLRYPGRNLSSRRNLVHQFLSQYQCESQKLTNDNKADAHTVLKTWQQETGHSEQLSDIQECIKAIELLERLGLEGEIYYIDRKPVAFLIGEMITSEMFCVHFLKADRLYKGIYQYIYQDFARTLTHRASWVNLEQDVGVDALRRAKSSYHPDKMGVKWRVDWNRK